MDEMEIRSTLTIPLYWAFYLEDLEHFNGLPDRDMKKFRYKYGREEMSAMVEALIWAEMHPDEAYSSMLPHLPHTDQQLHKYLSVLRRQFETQYERWFGGS